MKSIVIYHSMSGNTKKIAEAIHAGMSQTGEQCDIRKLGDVRAQDLANYDLIGLGSPVINMKELGNVTNFIEYTMEFVDGKHGFAFCTHGALPGHYLSRVVPAMMQRGIIVIGWNDWFCSVFYPVTPKPYFTDGHPDEIDLEEGKDFGREMVERSRKISLGETSLIPTFPKGKEYDELYDPSELGIPSIESSIDFIKVESSIKFNVNKEKCNYPKCTHCIDNCPNHSIDFSVSPPRFDINCGRCYLCEQTCPRGAIEADWAPLQEIHDPLTISYLQKSLELFEARGRFRRLVPLEAIGWDSPFWKRKPPRFKVA
jgi:NAD-dependent dihydropyrimidine dehydrogenase PreA subunit